MPLWCNGSHASLRSLCRKACRFESDQRYMLSNIKKIQKFNWFRILLPLTTYYMLKNNGLIHPILFVIDLMILCIPFSTIFVVVLVKFILNDIKDEI